MSEVFAARLQAVLERVASDPEITGTAARIEHPGFGLAWEGAVGDLAPSTPFFIASTTKLYTTAIVVRLIESGELEMDDRLVDIVDGPDRLHVHKGEDHTTRITVRHLLTQTSGLPDYFRGQQRNGQSFEDQLRGGTDRGWDLDYVLATAREMSAAFPPGAPKKALYSDTNLQLLGKVIENVSGASFNTALADHVIEPLGLKCTWLYVDPNDSRPAPLRDGDHPFPIPQAMASFGPDGGIVAGVADLMTFLRSFFEGGLFPVAVVAQLMSFNRIFFPLQYGVGVSRFRLPRVMSPLSRPPDLVGHSGLSGAFAFRDTVSGVYLAGTVNNVDKPDRSFRMMLRMLRAIQGFDQRSQTIHP